MTTESKKDWCSGARTGDAPVHQREAIDLKVLALNALRKLEHTSHEILERSTPSTSSRNVDAVGAAGASGARGASGASGVTAIQLRLLALADTVGIPRAVVDNLPVEELEATAEQVASAEGYKDGNGDPLPQSLLSFYLRCLADQAPAEASS